MFTDFFYLLRSYGMKTSLVEWSSLLAALELNLHQCSLLQFYHLARAVLVKREAEYDRFDQAFQAYFKNLTDSSLLPPEFYKWLEKAIDPTPYNKEQVDVVWGKLTLQEIRDMMEDRLKHQKEAHHGGQKWIGTGGQTAFGHSGYAPQGIRVLGESHRHSALQVAGERKYRDFRDDVVLDIRQFQMALRKLRRLSDRIDAPKTELDVEGTIAATSKRAGLLDIVMKRPRRNTTKVLLLMDSGGSMWPYMDLSRKLFQAVNQDAKFKDLKIYFFHNIFYEYVFPDPGCDWKKRVATQWLFQNLKSEYKVLIMGDARMAQYELLEEGGSVDWAHPNKEPGLYWLQCLLGRYPATVWLNPVPQAYWTYYYTTRVIMDQGVPMFPMSVKGLEKAIDTLRHMG